MRSPTGLAAATIMLLAVPVAFGSQILADGAAEIVLHFVVGAGCLVLAAAMFDFGLPRWLNLVGAAAAAAFGSIFLLQGISQIVEVEALSSIAFDVLGQEIERVLPYVVVIWFVALLALGSRGTSRILGGVVMSIVIGVELVSIVGPLAGIAIESQKVLFLLPFIWLLVESVERRTDGDTAQTGSTIAGQPKPEALA